MKFKTVMITMALSALLAGSAIAQDGPPGRPPRPDGPDGRDRDRGPGRDGDRPGMGGFGRGDDGDGFPLPPQMRMFQAYLTVVEQSARISRDASTSGMAAVAMAGDLL